MRFPLLSSAVVLLFTPLAARADSVTFDLLNGTASATAGSTLLFSATTTAASTNTGTEYLNGLIESFTPIVPSGNIDDADYFYSTYAATLGIGQSTTGTIFSILVPADALPGTSYTGTITLQGGSSDSAQDALGTGILTINVAPALAATPEPSSLCLLGTAATIAAALLRRRQKQSDTECGTTV